MSQRIASSEPRIDFEYSIFPVFPYDGLKTQRATRARQGCRDFSGGFNDGTFVVRKAILQEIAFHEFVHFRNGARVGVAEQENQV